MSWRVEERRQAVIRGSFASLDLRAAFVDACDGLSALLRLKTELGPFLVLFGIPVFGLVARPLIAALARTWLRIFA
jgi:hypothetical protein